MPQCVNNENLLTLHCGNYGFLSHDFDKNFVKAMVLLKSWSDEIFFGEREYLVLPHCTMLL